MGVIPDPSWRTGKTTSERGYGRRWQVERADFLRRHPLCRMHQKRGQVVAARVVDHIVPHRGDQRLFWDQTNWQSLCKPCHDSAKKLQEHGKSARRWGEDGYPIDDDGGAG